MPNAISFGSRALTSAPTLARARARTATARAVDIGSIAGEGIYDRILSVATLEHLTELPTAIARAPADGYTILMGTIAESMISDLLRDAGEGAGDDQADAGTKTFEREHEMSLAANSRDMLEQTSRALARIDAGTYGVCESCGNPIGKRRLQAFPRATLCMTCKQREERR